MADVSSSLPLTRVSRRAALAMGGASAASVTLLGIAAAGTRPTDEKNPIRALTPRGKPGHQFVLYSDCCAGIPNGRYAANLQSVNRTVARIRPEPEFISFPGDAISGYITDYAALRKQWEYWSNTEMAWLKEKPFPLYQSTSNHNTYDDGSEKVFREVHPDIPQNGRADQKGLAYFVRRDDLLYVSTHQPDRRRTPNYRPGMLIDSKWLDRILTENKDARFKFVAGHYPVFPVNGYVNYPLWCFKPEERRPFWKVLVKHRVDAYLASHIIAFDVQVHDGVLQIVSGGAGTNYGPGGFMPGRTEYLHAVQMAVDDSGLRYQVLDIAGKVRESLVWPFSLPKVDAWTTLTSQNIKAIMTGSSVSKGIVGWRFRGTIGRTNLKQQASTLLCGWNNGEGVATVWIGFDGNPPRATVRLVPESTYGSQTWTGPIFKEQSPFDFQIALHPGMGPSGVLFRKDNSSPWSSLSSASSRGDEILSWPPHWAIGMSQSGTTDRQFQGTNLDITWTRCDVPGLS